MSSSDTSVYDSSGVATGRVQKKLLLLDQGMASINNFCYLHCCCDCCCLQQCHLATSLLLLITNCDDVGVFGLPAGAAPVAGLVLWQLLLEQWALYDKWLHLVVSRCSMLGSRVAAARQLMEPSSSSSAAGAALIPHLRNKGLILFRWDTPLCECMRAIHVVDEMFVLCVCKYVMLTDLRCKDFFTLPAGSGCHALIGSACTGRRCS